MFFISEIESGKNVLEKNNKRGEYVSIIEMEMRY